MKRYVGPMVILALLLGGLVVPVAGQPQITVLQDDFSYTFNEALIFELTIESTEVIPAESVRLLYSVGDDEKVVNRHEPEYEPAKRLSLRVRDALERGEIPPASQITYHWEIKDAAGNVFETEHRTFFYMDNRFQWESLTEGPITIYWYGRVDGPDLLDAAVKALARLEKTINYKMEKPIKIVVYENRDDMQDVMAPRGRTFDQHIVTLGTVVAPDIMLLLGRHADVKNTIAHELTHMVVGAATENPFAEIPAWLNEGLAMYNQDFVESLYEDVLKDAVRQGDLDTVRRLSARTGDPSRVNLWYAEVWSVVDFLISQYGEEKMAALLTVFSRGAHPDDALMEVYGFDRDGLTARWWTWLGAELPPSLQEKLTPPAAAGGETGGQNQAPAEIARPTAAPAPAAQPEEAQSPQPTGLLACCIGILPLGLLIFGGLHFRRRAFG